MNPVIHFEMPAEDKKRMSNFYTNVFGWQTQQMGAGFFDPAGSQQRLRQSKPVERITFSVKKGRLEIVDGGLRPARLQFSFAPRVPLPGQRLLRLMIAPGGEARHGEEETQGK